jgi:hypothetical protein
VYAAEEVDDENAIAYHPNMYTPTASIVIPILNDILPKICQNTIVNTGMQDEKSMYGEKTATYRAEEGGEEEDGEDGECTESMPNTGRTTRVVMMTKVEMMVRTMSTSINATIRQCPMQAVVGG